MASLQMNELSLQPYSLYRESEQKWLGMIPDHWSLTRLKYLLNIVVKKATNLDEVKRYVGLENIESKIGKLIDGKQIQPEGDCLTFQPGDVLFSKLRPYLAKAFLATFEGRSSSEFLVMRPKSDRLFAPYLIYLILSFKFIDLVNSSTYGAKMPRASWDFIGNIVCSIPTIEEQKQIVTFLDYHINLIDTIVADKEHMITKLQEQRQAIISESATKWLDHTVPLNDSGVEGLGKVPKHWGISRIKYISKLRGRIGFRGYTVQDLVEPGEGALTLGAKHIDKSYKIDLSEPEFLSWEKFYESPEIIITLGDILVTQRGSSIGKVALIENDIGDATINPSLMLLKNIKCLPKFLYFFLSSNYIQQTMKMLVSTTAIPMLTQEQVNNFRVCVPSLEEQEEIVKYIESHIEKVEKIISNIKTQIEKLREYRQSLITEAVSGKIDVRGWKGEEVNDH
jgi:type I restriction enzyme, S subunit